MKMTLLNMMRSHYGNISAKKKRVIYLKPKIKRCQLQTPKKIRQKYLQLFCWYRKNWIINKIFPQLHDSKKKVIRLRRL